MIGASFSGWRSRREEPWFDDAAFVGLALAPALLVAAVGGFQDSGAGVVALYVLATTPVLLGRRRWPVPAFAWTLALTALLGVVMAPALLIALYGLLLSSPRAVALAAAAVAAVVFALAPGYQTSEGSVTRVTVVAVVVAVGLWRATRLDALRDRAERQRREHELLADQAVAEERVRIARELHDVVAHNVSLMVVQAQAVAADANERDRAALDSLADTGREAMTEMHRMLGVLRVGADDKASAAERSPQPGVEELDTLVARARAAGLDIRLAVEGTPRALPPTIDLTAYRIVQEALTNVVKHAGDARTEIVLRYAPGQLELRVEDDGGAQPHTPDAAAPDIDGGGGHGLAGMRERVALFGGALDAGPRGDRAGYRVHAVLPSGSGR